MSRKTRTAPTLPEGQRVEYDYLRAVWEAARRRVEQTPGPAYLVWDAIATEVAAWVALVAFLNAHDLAGTGWDPRPTHTTDQTPAELTPAEATPADPTEQGVL